MSKFQWENTPYVYNLSLNQCIWVGWRLELLTVGVTPPHAVETIKITVYLSAYYLHVHTQIEAGPRDTSMYYLNRFLHTYIYCKYMPTGGLDDLMGAASFLGLGQCVIKSISSSYRIKKMLSECFLILHFFPPPQHICTSRV